MHTNDGPWLIENGYIISGKTRIAVVLGTEDFPFLHRGNASLLSAAPDLLEALKEMLCMGMAYYHMIPNNHRQSAEEYYDYAIKAIEKAEKSW